ncbi:hypothetical protein ACE6H2_027099 [Prunus campanulata]
MGKRSLTGQSDSSRSKQPIWFDRTTSSMHMILNIYITMTYKHSMILAKKGIQRFRNTLVGCDYEKASTSFI